MGLTIHYMMTPPEEWTWGIMLQRLYRVHSLAQELPHTTMTDIVITQPDKEEARYVESPWQPCLGVEQIAGRSAKFQYCPAEGSEWCEFGTNLFTKYKWRPVPIARSKDNGWGVSPNWLHVLKVPADHSESYKIIRQFMKKWQLRISNQERFPQSRTIVPVYESDQLPYVEGIIKYGRYLSHRKGYSDDRAYLRFRGTHRLDECLLWLQRCGVPASESLKVFQSKRFQRDVRELMEGIPHTTPSQWYLRSFCKTEYAYHHSFHNFIVAHLCICALLLKCRIEGFKVDVTDECEIWDNWQNMANQFRHCMGDRCLLAFQSLPLAGVAYGTTPDEARLNHLRGVITAAMEASTPQTPVYPPAVPAHDPERPGREIG